MAGNRRGIAVAGNIMADVVKNIGSFPKAGMLAEISDVFYGVGGQVPNTAVDLAGIDRELPVKAFGRTGDDANGRFVLGEMERRGIDIGGVRVIKGEHTGTSDIMSLPGGERTIFSYAGANRGFSPADIDLSRLECDILHIGYIMLLDVFDGADPEYGTVMARFLHDVGEYGIKTSVDTVSVYAENAPAIMLPAVRYCDYVIINEIELGIMTSVRTVGAGGEPDGAAVRAAMEKLAGFGVKSKVIIHCKSGCFCLDVPTGEFTAVGSLKIPPAEIKGCVGAGDAFCAGALYSLYHGRGDRETLEFASAAAAESLFAENTTDSMPPRAEIEKAAEKYGRSPAPAV